MTSETPFPKRFQKVDELALCDHYYLSEDDVCYYIGEYTAKGGFAYSDTNSLVLNFKKDPDRKGRPEWRYKGLAIQRVAATFREALGEGPLRSMTFVPIPPSSAKDDPMHDDRLCQMLRAMEPALAVDIREMIGPDGEHPQVQ